MAVTAGAKVAESEIVDKTLNVDWEDEGVSNPVKRVATPPVPFTFGGIEKLTGKSQVIEPLVKRAPSAVVQATGASEAVQIWVPSANRT